MTAVDSFNTGEKIRSIFANIILAIFFIAAGLLVAVIGLFTLGRLSSILVNIFGRSVGQLAFFLMGIKREIVYHYPLPEEPVLYIFNHTSTLDIPITLSIGIKNTRYVAKYELMFNPVFGIIGIATGQVFINRGTSAKAIKSLKKAYERVKKDKLSLVIAPEGTRNHVERVGKFKKGAFHTAKDLGYKIVPLYFENSYNLAPASSLFFHKGTIKVHINEPISTEGWTNDNLEEKIALVRDKYVAWSKELD